MGSVDEYEVGVVEKDRGDPRKNRFKKAVNWFLTLDGNKENIGVSVGDLLK